MSQNKGDDSADAVPADGEDSHLMGARSVVKRACVEWEADLKAFLLGVLRDRHQADDIFQKTVVKAIEAAESARQETLRGWLFRISLNEARYYQREHRRDARHRERLAEQRAAEQTARITGEDAEWMADLGLVSDDLVAAIRKSVVRLTTEQQDVIQKRIYEGLTFAEIAKQMDQPLGTVLTWMRRGLQKLKEDSSLRELWED